MTLAHLGRGSVQLHLEFGWAQLTLAIPKQHLLLECFLEFFNLPFPVPAKTALPVAQGSKAAETPRQLTSYQSPWETELCRAGPLPLRRTPVCP